jgi:hypothetical protein
MKSGTLKMREWRKKNPERQRENDRRWRGNNLKKARAKNRKWYWANRDYKLKQNELYIEKNRKKVNARIRLHRHGMTRQQHDDLLREQKGCCAICQRPFGKTPHVDHNHRTGKNRGLLCRACNHGIGNFEDNIKLLRSAIQYLRRHK